MRFILFFLFSTFLTFCSARNGSIEPILNEVPFVDELKLSVDKMKNVLSKAPDKYFQEKKQAFISLKELENDVQKLSDIFNKRVLFVQSFNKIKQDDDEDDDENNDLEQNLNSQEERPTPEEAEELMKQLTTKIWKTTDEILRAHTGISGLVGALPSKTIT